MDVATKEALQAADKWLSDFWATKPIGAPDPVDVINQIRDVLGEPRIVNLLAPAGG
jgi:hypothetical protein